MTDPFALYPWVKSPTLLIDPVRVKNNIQMMAGRANAQGIKFRPHFKTHQSAAVGEWFRQAGVEAITVSSVEMGQYFSRHGWKDITVAFSLNLRQLAEVDDLAGKISLGVLVESREVVEQAGRRLNNITGVWIKVETGSNRTGVSWTETQKLIDLAELINQQPALKFLGLLTHAGYTYKAGTTQEIIARYQQSTSRMLDLRREFEKAGINGVQISVGDTPGCTLSPDLGVVDEIRPGNFVFYDAQMLSLGVCKPEQVAGVVACPVVAIHPEREEAVVYGGAVHLSKDTVSLPDGPGYGSVVELHPGGWSSPVEGASVVRLSQEHGILRLPREILAKIKPGDLLGVLPAHICLTVSALGSYTDLNGTPIYTYLKEE